MDAQTKRTLAATALCMLLLFGWMKIQSIYNPPPPVAETQSAQDSGSTDTSPPPVVDGQPANGGNAVIGAGAATVTPSGDAISVVGGESTDMITLGDDRQTNPRQSVVNPYKFAVAVSPVGASVDTVHLTDHRSHVAKSRKNPDHAPYELLRPVNDPFGDRVYRSFVTERIWLDEYEKHIDLSRVAWSARKETDAKSESAVFTATIRLANQPLLRLTKTYRITADSPLIDISYDIENLSIKPVKIRLTESGPTGFKKEDQRYDHARAVSAVINGDGRIKLGEHAVRSDVRKTPERERDFTAPEGAHILWSAVSNKYFACIVAPQPEDSAKGKIPQYFTKVYAKSRIDSDEVEPDLTVVQVYSPTRAIEPGENRTLKVEAYCGPKSDRVFDALPLATDLHFTVAMAPDRSGCTFDIISNGMLWLLAFIHGIVGNYGLSIIFLVIAVRALLHPISKKGQINMMRMQKNMSRIKPKIESIQEQYKNDKQKLNEETMKLYREEGINPAGQMMGCLPMFLQMPIWVALYTTLNTNVDLRHAPFFGYIRDLSAPDALIHFSGEFHIPLISSMMGGAITSFNLLPIIMTLLMYGQQKLTQKLTKPDKPPEPKKDKDGNPLPDQMAQQQKIMNFMMIFMGFIFYNMPSGLCLYILCSSFIGMCEQWYIRKHVKEREIRGDFDKPAQAAGVENGKPKGGGWLQRKFAEMQKIAEEQRIAQNQGRGANPGAKRKKNRF
ncbi:MAG: membrane protein insertase YidC [Planctomycetes bacterium]|nr:membrane protein insertase YidC [Planctomycetota bacterium]